MDTMQQIIDDQKITMQAEFVPFSKSRHAKEKIRNYNYKVAIFRDGREVLTTDYSMGLAFGPKPQGLKKSSYYKNCIENEQAESGCKVVVMGGDTMQTHQKILPQLADVLRCLAVDADALHYADFEDWCCDFGYDTDSISARKTYDGCLSHALKMQSNFGKETLEKMRQAVDE